MTEVPNPALAAWQSFYVIVGSSGAALIGVQFVVITLVATLRRRTTAATIGVYATPTVVHLGGALIVSALMSAPWRSLALSSVALAMCGLGGLGYATIVMRRARHETAYKPVWEDWIWHAVLPFSAYAAVAAGALLLRTATHTALFVIGAATLGVPLIGIHNAWDAVTHFVATGSDGNATGAK